MKRWIKLALIAVALLIAGLLAPFWLSPLLDFLGTNADWIQGLDSLVQLLLLAGSAVLGFLGYQQRKRTAAPTVVNTVNTGGGSAIDGSATLWGDGDFVGRDKITVILAQSARHFLHLLPKSSLSREALQSATESYLRYHLDRHRFLNLKGLGVSDRVPLRLPLLELYVPLKARLTLPEGETWRRGLQLAGRRLSEEEQEALTGRLGDPRPVLDLLQKHDGLIILGDPGAGKTTFLKVLALNLALGQGEALGLNHRLPVLLPLSAYANALAERVVLRLDDFIATYLHEIGSDLPIADLVAEALRSGQALILLDGLDEVKNPAQRHTVVERVVDFYTLHRRTGNKFVLTSRIVGYREARPNAVPGLAECTLVDFEEAEITDFVTRWTRALERQAQGESAVAQADAAREREELLEAIDRNPGVRRLAANPLLLTILAVMKRQGVILPERRVELYDQYVKTLLSSWNRARGLGRAPTRDLDVVQTVRVLAPLALWMHEENPGVGLVKREALRRRLEALFAEQQVEDAAVAARQFLADVREHAGLLLERGPGEYGFIHLTFEEYLAAVVIARRGQGDCRPIVDYLSARVGDAAWREVALLTVPYLGIIQQLEEVAGEVVEALVAEQPGEAGAAVVLAGQAVLDAGATGVPPTSRQRVTEALVKTMQNVEVAPVLRREAGLVLGQLGWEPEDLDTFVPVPAGPFLYGDEKREREITQPYWIGKYPVTNAQYARFVEAGGYQRRAFWSAEGWASREKAQRERPDYWQDARFDNPIFPVVGVTQYEAAAYCTWLTAQLQAGALPFVVWEAGQWLIPSVPWEALAARLPAEEEWERAARGVDGREYPWGATFEALHLNCADAWAGQDLSDYDKWRKWVEERPEYVATTAVCTYPQGISPVGVWDLSGNVWEWTGSALNADYKVLRGGSWNGNRRGARCAFRLGSVPDNFLNNDGFRVVVSLVRG